MLKLFSAFVFSVLISLVMALPPITAHAQGNCQLYDTTGEVVDVFKTPSTQGAYFELLERGDITCISRQQQSGSRNWGFIEYRKDKSGQKVVVKGWVDLQFVARKGGVTPARATPQQGQPSGVSATRSTASETNLNTEGAPAAEVAYWNTVRDSRDPDLIRLYLEKYPDGTFGDLAQAMIAKLQPGTVTTPTTDRAKAYIPPPSKTTRTKKSKKSTRTTRRKPSIKKKRAKKKVKRKSVPRRASRQPRKTCRYENQFECFKRGGDTTKGRCDVRYICR